MVSVGPAAPAALAYALPIGRTVADSNEAPSLDKGLHEAWRDRVLALPIPRQAAQQSAQNVTGQVRNLHVGQDQKAGVVTPPPEMLAPLRPVPANEGLASSYLPGRRAKKRAGQVAPVAVAHHIAQRRSRVAAEAQIVMPGQMSHEIGCRRLPRLGQDDLQGPQRLHTLHNLRRPRRAEEVREPVLQYP